MHKNYGEYDRVYAPEEPEPMEDSRRKYTYDLMSGADLRAVLNSIPVIVVKAWAPWCRPCKKAGVKFEALGEKFNEFLDAKQLLLLNDNIDEETSHHRPMTDVVPSFFVYVNGQLVELFTGVDFDKLENFLAQHFQNFQHQRQPLYEPLARTPVHHLPPPSTRAMPQIKSTISYPPKNI